jgi:predicted acylesterase/phospholipase RssA
MKKKWGLVLSGGFASGLAHAGVLEVLDQEGLRPDCIAGNSMGAIIGGLYAFGIRSERISVLVKKLRFGNLASLHSGVLKGIAKGGLLRQNLEDHVRPLIGDACIGDCRIPFLCAGGRLRNPLHWKGLFRSTFAREWQRNIVPYVFPDDVRLIDAMLASSAVPIVFQPVTIREDTFVDSGNLGNIPARQLRERYSPGFIVACDTAPRFSSIRRFCPPSIRILIDGGEQALKRERAACDLIIEPHPSIHPLRFDKGTQFIAAGRKAAGEKLGEIRMLVK